MLAANVPPQRSAARNRREADQLMRQRLGTLSGRARGLARILEETGRPAEAAAARNIATALRALAGDPVLCPVCGHEHPIGTDCCTLCGWRTVRP